MKATDLRSKSADELEKELVTLREQEFRQNIQHATGQLGQIHLKKQVRRDIARVKTVLKEKKSGAGE
jgi:large subunit ribosomal protein L29